MDDLYRKIIKNFISCNPKTLNRDDYVYLDQLSKIDEI